MNAPVISRTDKAKLAKACLREFRSGRDTMQIATRFGISEARASKLIWVARSWEKGLPAEYEVRGIRKRVAA